MAELEPERLGATLAALRKERGLTGTQLGQLVRISQSKLSKIEQGAVRASPGDVELIAKELGVPDETATELVERARRLRTKSRPERGVDRRGRPGLGVELQRASRRTQGQDEVGDQEIKASHLRNYETTMIPGLLQTSEYTRHVLTGYYHFAFGDSTPYLSEIAEVVSGRARRQERLYDASKTQEFVILESTLSSPLLAPSFMLAQLDRLEQASKLPNVSLRIVPTVAELRFPLGAGFTMLDEDVLMVEIGTTVVLVRNRREVDFHKRVFKHHAEKALDDPEPLLAAYRAKYAASVAGPDGGAVAQS